jgi:hypothetical protein
VRNHIGRDLAKTLAIVTSRKKNSFVHHSKASQHKYMIYKFISKKIYIDILTTRTFRQANSRSSPPSSNCGRVKPCGQELTSVMQLLITHNTTPGQTFRDAFKSYNSNSKCFARRHPDESQRCEPEEQKRLYISSNKTIDNIPE